ncbi:MAG: hypothetical protein ACJ8AW_32550 [Rhodopila sp.]
MGAVPCATGVGVGQIPMQAKAGHQFNTIMVPQHMQHIRIGDVITATANSIYNQSCGLRGLEG